MEIAGFVAVVAVSAFNSAMPGPCVALKIACSARNGFAAGIALSLGTVLASICLCWVALLVMADMLDLGEATLRTMSWVCASLLAYQSIRILTGCKIKATEAGNVNSDVLRDFVAGLCVGICSPVNLVFMLLIFPHLAPDAYVEFSAAILTIAAVSIGGLLSSLVIVLIGVTSVRSRDHLVRPMECVSALAMIVFAVFGVTSYI